MRYETRGSGLRPEYVYNAECFSIADTEEVRSTSKLRLAMLLGRLAELEQIIARIGNQVENIAGGPPTKSPVAHGSVTGGILSDIEAIASCAMDHAIAIADRLDTLA